MKNMLKWVIVMSQTIKESGNEYWVSMSVSMTKREATEKMTLYALNELMLTGWRVASYKIYDDGRHICIEGWSGIQDVRTNYMVMTENDAKAYMKSFEEKHA